MELKNKYDKINYVTFFCGSTMKKSLFIIFITLFAYITPVLAADEQDPFEGFNRKVFEFNKFFDKTVLHPFSKIYGTILPDFALTMVSSELNFLLEPRNLVNAILTGDQDAIGNTLGRILFNGTFGILGLFDPATEAGLTSTPRDFGLTLKHYGVGTGPYVVVPILGPSSFRDSPSLIVDYFTDPFNLKTNLYWKIGRFSITALDRRHSYEDEINSLEQSALDEYTTYKSIYFQKRGDQTNENVE
jgi:phospholipid-binding lipoprotein MlaA